MPDITNRVLTSPGQQLSEQQKRNARDNIAAMERLQVPAGEGREFVMCAVDGTPQWGELGLVDDPTDT